MWKEGGLSVAQEDDRPRVGEWEPIKYCFQSLPVHLALLHTGKVLAFGGSGNNPEHLKDPYPAEVWDPKGGNPYPVKQDLAGDIFCAGHAFLPDGRLLVAGGTYTYPGPLFDRQFPPFTGLEQSYLFDPTTESWTRVQDMRHGRWYPTLATVGDGQIICMAGLTKRLPWALLSEVEVYSPGRGWRKLKGANRWLPLYPRLHLLPDGRIFYAGSYNTHYTFPFRLSEFPTATLSLNPASWTTIGHPREAERQEGTSILLPFRHPEDPPEVLLVGGGTPGGKVATNKAEIIDLSEDKPRWRSIDSMNRARYYTYAVILPDGSVLVLGGHEGEIAHHGSAGLPEEKAPDETEGEISRHPHAVYEPDMFDAKSKSWTLMAPMQLDRLYHANALLLPDGRVMVAGSNPPGEFELRIEIYRPPYMFQGPRPEIRNVPKVVSYGGSFDIETSGAAEETEVVLIRPTSTTHCVNTDQRYIGLQTQSRNDTKIVANVPSNRNLAPPGYYMLFLVREGIPSEAESVRLA